MKKIITLIITSLIFASLIQPVFALDGDFEVSLIKDDGTFEKVATYDNFNDAKNDMKTRGDRAVVRHYASLSPTKIIAMNSGVAYSYPGRAYSKTLNIYQDSKTRNIYYKQTYIANHYQLYYFDTEKYYIDDNGNGVGIVKVSINGFDGYADLEYVDLVPSFYLDNGISITLGGNNDYENEEPFEVICKRDYYEAVNNGNYYDLVFHYYRAYPKQNKEAISSSLIVGKAPKEMIEGIKYYSCDGINFYTDPSLTDGLITYYNYYQYLPLRSKTNINVSIFEAFVAKYSNSILKNHAQDFIDAQNNYGVNALLLFSMAIQESAYGTSGYAINRNNLFGWNAVDGNPNNASYFNSVSDCVNQQAGINLRGYLDITDGRFFSSSLGNKGSGLNVKYSSDPYWGLKIASIAYQIDKLASNNDGSYTDLNIYEMALINTFDVEIKQQADSNSNTLYTTQYGPYYQKDFIVIVLGRENDYTKIQSTNGIDDDGNIQTHRTPITTGNVNPISTYNYEKSVGYIKTNYLTALNDVKTIKQDPSAEIENMSSISNVKFENNQLIIEGIAFMKGISFNAIGSIGHTLKLINCIDDSDYKTYKATTVAKSNINFNDGYEYLYVGYKVAIPLNDVALGNYDLAILVNNGEYIMEEKLSSMNDKYGNNSTILNNLNYHLYLNSSNAYCLQLDVESIPSVIDYTDINKPSIRSSLVSIKELSLTSSLDFKISGTSFIYYCDFNDVNNIEYTLYIIDDKNNYKEIELNTTSSKVDYQKLLNSSYSLNNICFEKEIKLNDFKKGLYELILKVENGEYVDYLQITTLKDINSSIVSNSGNQYRFFVSKIRNRIMLEVK